MGFSIDNSISQKLSLQQPPTNNQAQESFGKMYSRCILLCSFVYFSFDLKASESFNCPLQGPIFGQKFPKYWYYFVNKNLFVTSAPLVVKIVNGFNNFYKKLYYRCLQEC